MAPIPLLICQELKTLQKMDVIDPVDYHKNLVSQIVLVCKKKRFFMCASN